jgi:enoyl-CoA hydratase
MTQTDKMLSRKEGGVGYLIFNNPERHNAVSLEMWEADPRRGAHWRRRQGLRVGC